MAGILAGKVALITGTAGGQGREAALRFAAEGAKVFGCDINREGNDETCRLVTANGGDMTGTASVDLSDPEAARNWVEAGVARYGRIDILYNNASQARFAEMGQFPVADWDACILMELNILFYVTEPAWCHLQHSHGVIINTGSVAGLQGSGPGGAAHAAAKGGVIALTTHWAQEGAPHGIRSVCISPGYIESPGTAFLRQTGAHQMMVDRGLIKRAGQPSDIAELAVFLASDKASFITGINYVVDGGRMLGGY